MTLRLLLGFGGLVWALVIGHLVTRLFLGRLRSGVLSKYPDVAPNAAPWADVRGVSPTVTGTIERLFFTVAVAFNVSGAVPAMLAWIGVKMLVDWNRPPRQGAIDAAGAMSAAVAGLLSMFFALTGGLIVRSALS